MSEPGLQIFSPGWFAGESALVLRNPLETLSACAVEDVVTVLKRAVSRAEEGHIVAGMLSYEAGSAFEPAVPQGEGDVPLAWFGVYDLQQDGAPPFGGPSVHGVAPFGNVSLHGGGAGTREAPMHGGGARTESKPPACSDFRVRNARFSLSRQEYATIFAGIKAAIREGDVYQVNFTAPLTFDFEGDALGLWRALTENQPVPFGAYVDTGDLQILSCSPELFFERHGERVVTRPMKGTVRRGADPSEDDALEAWLAADEKSRAENVMIVDLLRNDLSRCCIPGSVRVPKLFTTERYATIIQMTSEIEGRLRPGFGTADIFRSLFPCGSVTGAPKIEAMRLIDKLEARPRGVYCGAVGFMHGDRAVFNVGIRTAVVRDGSGVLGIGSGVVWDSDADSEYDECLLKAGFLTEFADERADPDGADHPRRIEARRSEAGRPRPTETSRSEADRPHLIETMRAEAGEIALLELHADRLRSSARELGYPYDEARWRRQVAAAIGPDRRLFSTVIQPDGMQKVRTTLASDGALQIHAQAVEADEGDWTVVLSTCRIDEDDLYRRHKTTKRRLYEHEYGKAVAAGYDEVLFLNSRGEVAEGSRTNVVVHRSGEWWTPPVESGALPGVYRRHLLESCSLVVRRLTPEDLERADEVYVCNALRGLVRAHVVLAPDKIREDVT